MTYNTSELSKSMKQLQQHLLTIESVLASMKDIHSDSRTTHRSGLENTVSTLTENSVQNRTARKRKAKDNFLGLSQRQIWSQVASAVTKAIRQGI